MKALPEQVDPSSWEEMGYRAWWHPAERRGYSGGLLLSKVEPLEVMNGLGNPQFDIEGRVIQALFSDFVLVSAYFPNSGRKGARLDYKLAFDDAFLALVDRLREQGQTVVFMGDLNVAHREIDIARPEENTGVAGWLPEERDWFERCTNKGWVDTFRDRYPDATEAFTYWEPWRERRARNIGWRIDYVCVDEATVPSVEDVFIESDVMGSDHCPVGILLSAP